MKTSGPTSGTPPITSTATPAVRWQTGQLLQATVVESSAGKILLAIGNRQFSSDLPVVLDKGQQLTVQIRSLGDVPVLRIISTAGTPSLEQAVRTLVPQQESMTPLLASLARLAQTPQPPVPPLIRELTQTLMRNLPDVAAVARPENLKTAIAQSGLFLERRLVQTGASGFAPSTNPAPGSAIQNDFKTNLLRLVQQLRNWSGSAPATPPSNAIKTSTPPLTPVAGNPAPPAPGTAPGAPQTAALPGSQNTGNARVAESLAQTTPLAADQLRRVVQQSGVRSPVTGTHSSVLTGTLSSTSVASSGTAGPLPAMFPGSAPPPFPGAAPAPQAAVKATIDLVNRIGNLHTDLLRQAEAAVARMQLHQLASQPPRDTERGLLEWLLELPVRRDDDVDLWSMRIARNKHEGASEKRKNQQRWTVQLAFDLPGLGPVQAQVTLNGERVSTRFWTGREDSLPLFRQHLQELQRMFDNVGLEVGELDCVPGPMPTEATAPSLLREKV